MAKGDSSPSPSGQANAPNTKMDQYSVMHHLMQQLGQQPSVAPSNSFGSAQFSGGGPRFGGGGQMGGQMGGQINGVQPDAGGGNNILGMLGNAGMTGGSMAPSMPPQGVGPAQPDPQQMFRRRMMGNNVS